MDEIATGVFRAAGTDVNWFLVREGADLTLVDGGWLGDLPRVLASIEELGCRPQDVRAVLLTHAHIDHLGALPHLRGLGVPVYADPAEVPHATGAAPPEQATPLDLVVRAWRPSVLAWSSRIIRAGALTHVHVAGVEPFGSDGSLDLPGRPLPVPCPGHTSGHAAYLFAEAGVLATGDALVTGHPTSRRAGPQLLPEFFAHDPAGAKRTLDVLAGQPADVLAPGHGDPWRGELADAVRQARAS